MHGNTGRPSGRPPERPLSEPESDGGETVAWCDHCGDERRFAKRQVDVARREEASPSPDVGKALRGQTAFVCENCGDVRADLIAEQAYDYEHSNQGFEVPPFEDEADATRAASGSVEPPPPPERATPARVAEADAGREERDAARGER